MWGHFFIRRSFIFFAGLPQKMQTSSGELLRGRSSTPPRVKRRFPYARGDGCGRAEGLRASGRTGRCRRWFTLSENGVCRQRFARRPEEDATGGASGWRMDPKAPSGAAEGTHPLRLPPAARSSIPTLMPTPRMPPPTQRWRPRWRPRRSAHIRSFLF